ncbi:MAG: hypothetical protein HQ567_17160 [Candidatus Nealsonbacteria bacterium]|nr:hypothetical protein [Candidatus Nealsonbacteria bacterium]
MKILATLVAGPMLGLLIGGPAQAQNDWSQDRVSPFAQQQATQTPGRTFNRHPAEPSGLAKLGHKVTGDVKKLGDGTKKFLTDATTGTGQLLSDATVGTGEILHGAFDVVTFKAFAAKEPPPVNRWGLREPKQPKKSFMDFLIRREEPKPVESFKDWWGLKRMDP